jgi:uncharacterized protein
VFSSSRPRRLARVDPRQEHRDHYEHGLQHLILELTQECNLRCRYCVYSGYYPRRRGYTAGLMDTGTAYRGIEYFLSHATAVDAPCISFYGGEPLLRIEIIQQCVEHALAIRRGAPIKFQLTTNGTIMNGEILDYLARRGVAVLVSLDGPRSCHDRNRVSVGGRPSASRVVENLELIRKTNPTYYREHVGVASVLAANVDPSEVAEYFAGHPELIGNGTFVCSLVSNVGTEYWLRNPVSGPWRESFEALRWDFYEFLMGRRAEPGQVARALFEKLFVRVYRRRIRDGPGVEAQLNGCCLPGVRRLYLDCGGEFHVCERAEGSRAIGDVERGIAITRVLELVEGYCAIRERDCCQCWVVQLCQECFATCEWGRDGSGGTDQRATCAHLRTLFDRVLRDYCEIAEVNPGAFQYMDDMCSW